MVARVALAGPDQANLNDAALPLVADAANVLNGESAKYLSGSAAIDLRYFLQEAGWSL